MLSGKIPSTRGGNLKLRPVGANNCGLAPTKMRPRLATDHPLKKARECDERIKHKDATIEFERRGGQMQPPLAGFGATRCWRVLKDIDWEGFNAGVSRSPALVLRVSSRAQRGIRCLEREPSVAGLPQDDGKNNSHCAKKDTRGGGIGCRAFAASARRALLPVCRSWREHRPVYGPSLEFHLTSHWLGTRNSTESIRFVAPGHTRPSPPKCECLPTIANTVPMPAKHEIRTIVGDYSRSIRPRFGRCCRDVHQRG